MYHDPLSYQYLVSSNLYFEFIYFIFVFVFLGMIVSILFYIFLSRLKLCILYLFICICVFWYFLVCFHKFILHICIILCFVLGRCCFGPSHIECVFAFMNVKYPLFDTLWETFMFLTIENGLVRLESVI